MSPDSSPTSPPIPSAPVAPSLDADAPPNARLLIGGLALTGAALVALSVAGGALYGACMLAGWVCVLVALHRIGRSGRG